MMPKNNEARPLKQPCQICRNHKGGTPIKIRDDNAVLFRVTHIAHCPYCGRYLSENYTREEDKT